MPMTNESLIEFACLQYRNDVDFRAYADALMDGMRLPHRQFPIEVSLSSPATAEGTPLAKYVLERYEATKGKRPHSVC